MLGLMPYGKKIVHGESAALPKPTDLAGCACRAADGSPVLESWLSSGPAWFAADNLHALRVRSLRAGNLHHTGGAKPQQAVISKGRAVKADATEQSHADKRHMLLDMPLHAVTWCLGANGHAAAMPPCFSRHGGGNATAFLAVVAD